MAKYDNCLQKYRLRANECQRLPVYEIQLLYDMPSNYVKMCQYGLDRILIEGINVYCITHMEIKVCSTLLRVMG